MLFDYQQDMFLRVINHLYVGHWQAMFDGCMAGKAIPTRPYEALHARLAAGLIVVSTMAFRSLTGHEKHVYGPLSPSDRADVGAYSLEPADGTFASAYKRVEISPDNQAMVERNGALRYVFSLNDGVPEVVRAGEK